MIKYSQEESDFIGQWMILFVSGESLDLNKCSSNVKSYFDNMVKKEKLIFENGYYKAAEKFISKINYLKQFTKENLHGCH